MDYSTLFQNLFSTIPISAQTVVEFTIFSFISISWYFPLSISTDKSEKSLSWILTLLSSIMCSIGCIPLVYRGFATGWPIEILYSNDTFSRTLVSCFNYYLIWDTAFIYKFYPTIGGYHHHIPYFLMFWASLHFNCPGVFVCYMPMEVSTIFLAIGKSWPQYRMDWLFGVTFFLGRIVLHSYLSWRLWLTRAHSPIYMLWLFSLVPLVTHAQWFVKWCLLMRKKATQKSGTILKNSYKAPFTEMHRYGKTGNASVTGKASSRAPTSVEKSGGSSQHSDASTASCSDDDNENNGASVGGSIKSKSK